MAEKRKVTTKEDNSATKVDQLASTLEVGDKLVIKKNKKPALIAEHIRTMETELIVEDIKPTYVTLSYKTTKDFAKENDGVGTEKISFATLFLKDFFKKKDK